MKIDEPNGWIDVNTPKCDDDSVCYFITNNANWPTLTKVDTRDASKVEHLSTPGMNVLAFYGISGGT